jgi:uncharacterized DUF497 family protein
LFGGKRKKTLLQHPERQEYLYILSSTKGMDFYFRLQDIEFEWDENKARVNSRKHSVAFEEAAEVFFDPFYQEGDAAVDNEQRDFIIGYSLSNRLLLVVYTERGRRKRITSARRATRQERMKYEKV